MKCQILFSGKNKKQTNNIINLSSAELAKRVVKVKAVRDIFPKSGRTTFFLYVKHQKMMSRDLEL